MESRVTVSFSATFELLHASQTYDVASFLSSATSGINVETCGRVLVVPEY